MLLFFFFNDTATTEIYTLSLHDALPISEPHRTADRVRDHHRIAARGRLPSRPGALPHHPGGHPRRPPPRSEEHTSELQSRQYLVCRLLLEKKNKTLQILWVR